MKSSNIYRLGMHHRDAEYGADILIRLVLPKQLLDRRGDWPLDRAGGRVTQTRHGGKAGPVDRHEQGTIRLRVSGVRGDRRG
jgi:hypothetical protein